MKLANEEAHIVFWCLAIAMAGLAVLWATEGFATAAFGLLLLVAGTALRTFRP